MSPYDRMVPGLRLRARRDASQSGMAADSSDAPGRRGERCRHLAQRASHPLRVCACWACFSCLAARFSFSERPGFLDSPVGFCLFAMISNPVPVVSGAHSPR